MRGKALMWMGLFAAGAGAGWWLTAKSPAGPEVGWALVPIPSGQIDRLDLDDRAARWSLQRDREDGSWTASRRNGGTTDVLWPVLANRAAAGVRVLGDAAIVDRAGRGAFEPSREVRINEVTRLEFTDASVAGLARVRRTIDGVSAVVTIEAAGAEMWRDEALALWLDDRPIGCGLMPRPDEVRIDLEDRSYTLRRSFDRWALTEPFSAPADTETAEQLVGLLFAARGDARPDAPGPDGALVRVSVVDRDGVWGTDVDDAGNAIARGIYRGREFGPLAFAGVDLTRAIELLEPGELIAKRSARMPVADVASVEIRTERGVRSAARTVDGWDGDLAMHARQLIGLLCAEPATDASVRAPEGWVPLGTIELKRLGGLPGEEIEIGESGGRPATRVGGVYRTYDAAFTPLLRAIR